MAQQTFSPKPIECAPLVNHPEEHIDMGNDAISELELIDNLGNNAVKSLKLVQDAEGKFFIYVQLTWKGGELVLETQRKKPRAWSSLDRLVKHINQKYGKVPAIELHLRST